MHQAYVPTVAFYWSAKTVIFVLGAFHAQRAVKQEVNFRPLS